LVDFVHCWRGVLGVWYMDMWWRWIEVVLVV
jgi:hypothetical protein